MGCRPQGEVSFAPFQVGGVQMRSDLEPLKGVTTTYSLCKGALIKETYSAFRSWDGRKSTRANFERIRLENTAGLDDERLLDGVTRTLNRRFEPSGRDRLLVALAMAGLPMCEWTPILLWHLTRSEHILRDFLYHYVLERYPDDPPIYVDNVEWFIYKRVDRDDLRAYAWSDATSRRVAAALLRIAVDFGILKGRSGRRLAERDVSDRVFVYLLHAMRAAGLSLDKAVDSPAWGMFLSFPYYTGERLEALEKSGKIRYGAIQNQYGFRPLILPHDSLTDYAKEWVRELRGIR